jgi:hypothetical protein
MLNHEQLRNKASEITSLIIKNACNPVPNQFQVSAVFLYLLTTIPLIHAMFSLDCSKNS